MLWWHQGSFGHSNARYDHVAFLFGPLFCQFLSALCLTPQAQQVVPHLISFQSGGVLPPQKFVTGFVGIALHLHLGLLPSLWITLHSCKLGTDCCFRAAEVMGKGIICYSCGAAPNLTLLLLSNVFGLVVMDR
jgi:hypothetical protein